MLEIKSFTFNPFQENTYILHNEQKRALIIDPGAYFIEEKNALLAYIKENELVPLRLLNTHCHLDHVFSNKLVADTYNLLPEINKAEADILSSAVSYGLKYELTFDASPAPKTFLNEKDTIKLGEDTLSIFLAPGHSPGSICFYCEKQNFLIGGDVLFRESIGRTDLPGGNHEELIHSIQYLLKTLPDETTVYPGHGPQTTIGYEKANNPFIQ